MKVMIIDGQGGRLGRELVIATREKFPTAEILAVGTNSIATNLMLKAGANGGATGENPVIVGSTTADYILGPIAMVIADSLLGEVTEKMALAVSRSRAKRILIPLNMCDNQVAGVGNQSLSALVNDAVSKIIPD